MTTAAPATSCKQLNISPHIFPLHVLLLCLYPGSIYASNWLNARRRYHRDTDESTSAFGCGSEKSSRSGISKALANAYAVTRRVLREILTSKRSFTRSAKACTFNMGKRHVDIMSRNFQRLRIYCATSKPERDLCSVRTLTVDSGTPKIFFSPPGTLGLWAPGPCPDIVTALWVKKGLSSFLCVAVLSCVFALCLCWSRCRNYRWNLACNTLPTLAEGFKGRAGDSAGNPCGGNGLQGWKTRNMLECSILCAHQGTMWIYGVSPMETWHSVHSSAALKADMADSKSNSKTSQNTIPQTAAPWAKSTSTLGDDQSEPKVLDLFAWIMCHLAIHICGEFFIIRLSQDARLICHGAWQSIALAPW